MALWHMRSQPTLTLDITRYARPYYNVLARASMHSFCAPPGVVHVLLLLPLCVPKDSLSEVLHALHNL